jgi:hypothetical protein
MWRSVKYSWLLLICLAAGPTASAASPSSPDDPTPANAAPRFEAAQDVSQSVACNEQGSSLPTLKQELGKTLPKVAANGHRPTRLSRLRACSAVSVCGAFLPPDTLQIRGVRQQI